MTTVLIRNADWAIVWDEAAKQHAYKRGVDVAFAEGGAISFVGERYAGTADLVLDGRDRMVMPGLIDIHSHPEHEPAYRGIREEHGVANLYMTGLFERSEEHTSELQSHVNLVC